MEIKFFALSVLAALSIGSHIPTKFGGVHAPTEFAIFLVFIFRIMTSFIILI